MEAQMSDYVWGAKAIGAEIGKNERETWYLLERGQLPATKIGGRYVAHRAKLHAAMRGEACDEGAADAVAT